MPNEIIFKRSAENALDKLPEHDRRRLLKKLEGLRDNPFPRGSIKLQGPKENLYRIRSGNYRAIYTAPDNGKIRILKIAGRSVVYRR